MRKPNFTFLAAIAATATLSLAACNNKPVAQGDATNGDTLTENATGIHQDSLLADAPTDIAPDDQWTEEAVAQQVRKIYAEVNKAFAPSEDGLESNIDLDALFCTQYWNETLNQVRAINAQKPYEEQSFANEEMRWTYGLGTPLTPKNIKVELLTGNMATAAFELSCGSQWMHTVLALDWEDGQWRINDWQEVGDSSQGLLESMQQYINAR